ncbi:MAG: hypothetical protein R3315_11760 [Woeseiaceae bacterium]|nr:hypothetical protein [Woeseiaceae bacterium]
MPAPWFLRLPFVCGWTILCVRDAARQAAGFRQVSRITMLADGRLIVGRRDGRSDEARLADGSRIVGEFAWLRIRFADGRIHGELLGAKAAGAENWRRFKSLWQYGRRCE